MRVYLAGPYTHGDRSENVRRALQAATELRDAGHEPFCPHLLHFWDLVAPAGYDVWMRICLAWVSCAEAVVRLPGYSPGAEDERMAGAMEQIPAYYSVADFLEDWEPEE